MDVALTHEAKKLLKELYSTYCDRVANGMLKREAAIFDGAEDIINNVYGDMNIEDISFVCAELGRAGLLNNFYGSGIVTACELLPEGIAYMESNFKRTAKGLIEIVSVLKP